MTNEPRLWTYEEWQAMTEEQRAEWRELRRAAVEQARREHDARRRLNDALTVERFGRDR